MKDLFDNGLKLFLSKNDLERMYDFEEESMEGLVRERETAVHLSTEDRVRLIGERLDRMVSKMEDAQQKQVAEMIKLHSLDCRVVRLEETFDEMKVSLDVIQQLLGIQDSHQSSPEKENTTFLNLPPMNLRNRRRSNCVAFDSNSKDNRFGIINDLNQKKMNNISNVVIKWLG